MRILLTLDGSPFAEAALPAAVMLAKKSGGELRLMSGLEVPPIFVYPEFRSEDRITAESYLDRIAKGTGLEKVSTVVREGRVEDEILREAADWRADIHVMATHGRSGPARAWIGSTADRCIKEAARPLLIVRPRESGGVDPAAALAIARVVVPLDGSAEAERALPHALAMARMLDAPMDLVHVVTSLDAPEFPFAPVGNAEMNRNLAAAATHEAEAYLAPLVERMKSLGVTARSRTPRHAQAARAILSEGGKDMIVMTTRGLSGIRRALLGSSADKVVRGAEGPVLLIPPEIQP